MDQRSGSIGSIPCEGIPVRRCTRISGTPPDRGALLSVGNPFSDEGSVTPKRHVRISSTGFCRRDIDRIYHGVMATISTMPSTVCAEGTMIGQSRKLKKVIEQATMVASTGSTVLLVGGTGTGKGRVACGRRRRTARVHKKVRVGRRRRRNGCCVCASLPRSGLNPRIGGDRAGVACR